MGVKANQHTDLSERFWVRVAKSSDAECWRWLGRKKGGSDKDSERGRINVNGVQTLAHRVAWILTNGPIPDGMTIDHLCMNKWCVNPAHFEVVSRGENARRYMTAKKACVRGHEFTPENTYMRQGKWRICRACHRKHAREHKKRAKNALSTSQPAKETK